MIFGDKSFQFTAAKEWQGYTDFADDTIGAVEPYKSLAMKLR